MAKPIQTYVVDNVVSTLKGITTGAGFANNLDKNEQVTAFGESAPAVSKFPAVLVHVLEDTGDHQAIAGFVEHTMSLALQCIVRDGSRTTARATAQAMVADIQVALMADHTRGGYAIDSRVIGDAVDFDLTSLPHVYFTVVVEVDYRHGIKDPTSQSPSI